MITHLRLLLLALLFIPSTTTHAAGAVEIWNTTGKTVLEAGDQIQIMVSIDLSENFQSITLTSKTKSYYSSLLQTNPFVIKPLSDRPDRKEILIDFTVPQGFVTQDTLFHFLVSSLASNGSVPGYKSQNLSIRGIPKFISPTDNNRVSGGIEFKWNTVIGATQYQLQLMRTVDGINPKDHPEALITVLDTVVSKTSLLVLLKNGGQHQVTVRANLEGNWLEWVTPVPFEVLRSNSVTLDHKSTDIRFYPQPARSSVTIDSKIGYIRRATIYDMNGREISVQGNLSGILTELQVSSLPAGSYHVKLELDDTIISMPLIVK